MHGCELDSKKYYVKVFHQISELKLMFVISTMLGTRHSKKGNSVVFLSARIILLHAI